MKHLKFRDEYIPLVLGGLKKTTIRDKLKYRVGEIVYIADLRGNVYCRARITRIDDKYISELSEEDALRDGFKSLDELREALKEIYGELDESRKVYIIHFKII